MLTKATLKVELGSQKWLKSLSLRKNENFLRSARELIFSLKNFSLNLLKVNDLPHPGKNLHVEKNDPKITKNRIFGYGFLTTCRKSHFSTINVENNQYKV